MSLRSVYALRLLCGVLLLVLFPLAGREAEAADTDVTVNDVRDLKDPSPNIGGCSSTENTCTLRAAIMRANHRLTGTHTIRLPAGTFTITIPGRSEDDAETGDFDIRGNIVILGAGAKSTIISGALRDRVFDVRTGSLLLQELTVTGGDAVNAPGGGIRATAALTLNRVYLHANQARGSSATALGGGIYTEDSLSVVRSTISRNIPGNITAERPGPAPFLAKNISIRESTIDGVNSFPFYPGIEVDNSFDTEIVHSTIMFNGPGIDVAASLNQLAVRKLTIESTILFANFLSLCEGCGFSNQNCSIGPAIVRLGFRNLDSDGTCDFSSDPGDGNLNLVQARISGGLLDNGGQTPTHLLHFDSPAIDAGGFCSGVDQRGLPRPVDFSGTAGSLGPQCDMGAVELQAGRLGIAVLDPETATVRKGRPFGLSYLWRVPEPQSWRTLATLDLRVVERDTEKKGRHRGHDDEVVFWLRWTEATDTFELVSPKTGQPYGGAFPAGSNHVLETDEVLLDVRESSSLGSGPTGQEVTLRLALIFQTKSKHHEPFTIEVTATDDQGETQPFLALGSVEVGPPKKLRP